MKLYEFRIALPIGLEDFNRCCHYLVIRASKNEMESGNGLEIFKNDLYVRDDGTHGCYTEKRFHLAKNLPSWLKSVLGEKLTILTEKSWNEYPVTTTKYFNEALSTLEFCITSNHIPGFGIVDNALNLNGSDLKIRKVVTLNLVDYNKTKGYDPNFDTTTFKSKVVDLLPLDPNWLQDPNRIGITCYKLVRINIPYFGLLGSKIESYILKMLENKMVSYLSSAICWIDEWYNLEMSEIRLMEGECYKMLNEQFIAQFGAAQSAIPLENAEYDTTNESHPNKIVLETVPHGEGQPTIEFETNRTDSSEFEDALEDFEEEIVQPKDTYKLESPSVQVKDMPTTFTGYLFKLADSFFTAVWNIRYIVLSGPCLYYFDSRTDLRPKARVCLKDARISWVGEYMNRPYCFSITTKCKRTYYWSADTETSVKRWIFLLQILCETPQTLEEVSQDWFKMVGQETTATENSLDPDQLMGIIRRLD